MIDNFKIIQDFWSSQESSQNSDQFLFGQIMVRKKDGTGNVKSNNKIIKDLVFQSPEDFDTKKDEMISLCKAVGGRIYVNPNPRSFHAIAIEVAKTCLDHIQQGTEHCVRSAFATACGKIKPLGSAWVIDLDDLNTEYHVQGLIERHTKVSLRVPTVNGCHLITYGFDLRELRAEYPEVDIHKNNPTLLYTDI
tara:strand:+ start:6319 stop:6897 length:579 start_codon:yes stop_codon:yes gene_type:complete